MGFFDEYKDVSGGNYVKAEEKQVLIENGIPFQITSVVMDEANKYGPRYIARCLIPNGDGEEEQRCISFPIGNVESRNRQLQQMSEYLEREDAEELFVKLDLVGRSIIIRPAVEA